MAIQTLDTIKQWFKTSSKPTQTQFWDTWDSFRHKYEKVPVKDVEGLEDELLSKADKLILDNHLADKNAHASQVNTDWNSEFGFSQLINKPEFKTINGEPVLGPGDINIPVVVPQGLKSVLDTNSTANYGNSNTTIMGDDGSSKYNNLTIGSDSDMSSMLQLTNQVSLQYSKVGINTGSSISVSESGVNIKRSLNGKTTDIIIDEPIVSTQLKFPAKSDEGNTYIIATTDDLIDLGDMTTDTDQTVTGVKTFKNGKFALNNIANTFSSFLSNTNTATRTYTFQNRDGILLDNTDMSNLNNSLATKQSVFTGTSNYLPKSLNETSLIPSRILDNGNYIGIDTKWPPNKDVTFGYNVDQREIGIEDSISSDVGKKLIISAGRAINFNPSSLFLSISQNIVVKEIASDPNGDIYAIEHDGTSWRKANGSAIWVSGGFTAHSYPRGGSTLGINSNGDMFRAHGNILYKRNGRTGGLLNLEIAANLVACSHTSQDVYYSVSGDGIYKIDADSGTIILQALPPLVYTAMALADNGDLYVAVNKTIYKQSRESSIFSVHSTAPIDVIAITINQPNDIYISDSITNIYKQINAIGSWTFIERPIYNTSGANPSLCSDINGDIYITGYVLTTIKYLNINSAGSPNLNGGTLVLKAGSGKGLGSSKIQLITGQKTISGTNMQSEHVRAEIDENGILKMFSTPVYADNFEAISGGLTVGMEYRTNTGIKMEVY